MSRGKVLRKLFTCIDVLCSRLFFKYPSNVCFFFQIEYIISLDILSIENFKNINNT